MKILLTILLIIVTLNIGFGQSQFDTIQIYKEVNGLKSQKDHKQFWRKIYEDDQKHRGMASNDSIDCINIIKSCIYFNKFGYPNPHFAGKQSKIISLVWIHNKFPQTDFLTFPIIFEGYKNNRIGEGDFRNYYLRSIYTRQFIDQDYKDQSIVYLLKKINSPITKPINISELVKIMKEEQNFLSESHKEIGVWRGKTTYDTLNLNGKPVIRENKPSPIRIFQNTQGIFYLQKLHDDSSHYPQQLRVDKNKKNRFKIFDEQEGYFEIEENGTLKIVSEDGSFVRFTSVKK